MTDFDAIVYLAATWFTIAAIFVLIYIQTEVWCGDSKLIKMGKFWRFMLEYDLLRHMPWRRESGGARCRN